VRLRAASLDRVLGDGFLDTLREIAKTKVDLVCFTGDVADWGLPEDYAQATPRILAILDAVGVPRERLFVVPGNHDVNRNSEPGAWQEMRKLAKANPNGLSDWMGA